MMVLISIPLGLYTAKHEGGTADHVVSVLNQIIMRFRLFFSGILITLLFGSSFICLRREVMYPIRKA